MNNKNSYIEISLQSKLLAKFISYLCRKGKKFKSENLINFILYNLKYSFNIYSIYFFWECINKLKIEFNLKLRYTFKSKIKKIQGYPIIGNSQIYYNKSFYWLIKGASLRKDFTFCVRMLKECNDIIFNRLTESMKKKKEYYNYGVMFKNSSKFKW